MVNGFRENVIFFFSEIRHMQFHRVLYSVSTEFGWAKWVRDDTNSKLINELLYELVTTNVHKMTDFPTEGNEVVINYNY